MLRGAVYSVLSLFPINADLMFFHQFASSAAFRTMTEQKYRQSGIWGVFVAEDWSCWAGEGAEVNYSITGWLSQELFKHSRPAGD